MLQEKISKRQFKLASNFWSLYRIIIIGGCGLGKTNVSLNLMIHQPEKDKINIYAKDPYEANINC